MGLLLLRIFAALFVLTTLVALMSAGALRKRTVSAEPQNLMALWRVVPGDDEGQSIQRRFRLCVKLALFSGAFVVGSIALAMNDI